MSRNTTIIGSVIVSLSALALMIWLSAAQTKAGLLRPDDVAHVARGKQVYEANCASCHGDKLQGQPNWKSPRPDGRLPAPPHDQTGHTWHHADHLLFDLTKFGLKKFIGDDYQSDMPTYEETLTDKDIISVLSFIKSTWPPEIRTRHNQINAAAAANKPQ